MLKRSFAAYGWINPKNSTLYLNEYSVMANLRYFDVEDLLPAESLIDPKPSYHLDDNWVLRGLNRDYISQEKHPLNKRLEPLKFDAKSLREIFRAEHRNRTEAVAEQIQSIEDRGLANSLTSEFQAYENWIKAKPTVDQRKKQRYYESIAEKLWYAIPDSSYIEIHDLARKFKISGKHVFRLFGVWTRLGLLDSVDLNSLTNGRRIEYFDIRRTCKPLIPIRYVFPKADIPQFNKEWRGQLRRIV